MNQRRTPWNGVCHALRWSALALLAALLPCSLLAEPIVVSINDVPNGAPVIQVKGALNGYDIYTGEDVATPGVEDGALITLIGVDTGGSIPEWGGRFVVPNAPLWYRSAVDIVWVTHDVDVFGNGDLQVGFNSALPGTYYFNPGLVIPGDPPIVVNTDEDLGLVTDKWVEVYADDTLVVRFKPHTYRLTVERPFKATGIPTLTVDPDDPSGASGTFLFVGTATHLGNFVFSGTWGIIGMNETGGYVYDIQGTYTAANGGTIDIVCPDWGVDNDANSLVSTGIVHIIGGTGRFADASGSYLGTLSPAPTPTLFTAEGTISY